jgi:hypothetical protein
MRIQEEFAGAVHSEPKEAAAIMSSPSPCNPPTSEEVIDDLAALVIVPSSGDGGVFVGNPEEDMALLFFDGLPRQFF